MGSVSQDDRGSGTPYDLTHNDEGRLVEIAQGLTSLATYKHNAFGQRVVKTAGATTTHYHYDLSGRLIAESDGTGSVQREFIHLGSLPLAVVDHTVGGGPALYHVHADHLGTPRRMTDGSKTVVWDAVFRPFGEVESLTGTATNDNRFQGQRLDDVAGFHYNYFRDYDPRLGRYIQSDPIGLEGGINTYAYAHNDPIGLVDPKGLEAIFGSGGIGANECDATEEEALVVAGATVLPLVCLVSPSVCKKIFEKLGGAAAKALKELKNLTKPSLRRAYEKEVRDIAKLVQEMKEAGKSAEEIARAAHAARRSIGDKYKDLTPQEKLAEITARNQEKYGDARGPTIQRLREMGKTWEDIAESASRPGGRDLGF